MAYPQEPVDTDPENATPRNATDSDTPAKAVRAHEVRPVPDG